MMLTENLLQLIYMDDEVIDLVDRDDNVIGTINRIDYKVVIEQKLGYFRVSDLFILNSQGQIYIPTRTADKTVAPGGYDFSVSGHLGAGESYLTTVLREAEEELNLQLSQADVELVGKINHDDVKYISTLYVYRSDLTPQFNSADFTKGEWMKPEDLAASLKDGHPAKTNLVASIELLIEYLGK